MVISYELPKEWFSLKTVGYLLYTICTPLYMFIKCLVHTSYVYFIFGNFIICVRTWQFSSAFQDMFITLDGSLLNIVLMIILCFPVSFFFFCNSESDIQLLCAINYSSQFLKFINHYSIFDSWVVTPPPRLFFFRSSYPIKVIEFLYSFG